MNRQAWTANTLPVGLLLLALGVLCAFAATSAEAAADDGETKGPEMSPEARIIGDPDEPDEPADGSFSPDPYFENEPYDEQAQLDIYRQVPRAKGLRAENKGRYLNPTPDPPLELGRRLYDRGTYAPRPTWLGRKNPLGSPRRRLRLFWESSHSDGEMYTAPHSRNQRIEPPRRQERQEEPSNKQT